MYFTWLHKFFWIVGESRTQGKHRTIQQTQPYSSREHRIKEKGACIQQHIAKQRWSLYKIWFFFHLILSTHQYMESHNIISFSFLRCMDKELMSIRQILPLNTELWIWRMKMLQLILSWVSHRMWIQRSQEHQLWGEFLFKFKYRFSIAHELR